MTLYYLFDSCCTQSSKSNLSLGWGVSYLYLLFVPLLLSLGLLVRILPVIQGRILGTDAYYHLLVAEKMRKNHGFPQAIDSFVVHGTYAYPPLFHIILSLVINRIPKQLLRTLSAVFDVGHGVLLFAFAWVAIGQAGAIIALTAYLVTPVCVTESFSLTPRTLGSLWLSGTLLSLTVAFHSSLSIIFVAVASVCFALTLLTQKMATQTLLFVVFIVGGTLAFTAHGQDLPIVFFALLFGIILAFTISKGHYIRVLKEHLDYLRFHRRYGSVLTKGKNFGNVVKIFGALNPLLVLVCFALVENGIGIHAFSSEITLVLTSWAFSVAALAIFWRYGDAERHILFSAAPSALLVGYAYQSVLSQTNLAIYVMIVAYCMFIIYVSIRRLSRPFVVEKNLLECFTHLSSPPAKVIMTIPTAYAYAAAYYTKQRIASGDASFNGLQYEAQVLSDALQGTEPFKRVLAELNVTHLVVEGEYHIVSELTQESYLEVDYRKGEFTVFRVRKQIPTTG